MKFCKYIFLFVFISQLHAQRSDFESIDFKKADSIALAYKYEKLINIPELAHKLTSRLPTQVEKFRAIYKWICENVANDYKQYAKNKRKRYRYHNDSLMLSEWNLQFKKSAFRRLLRKNKATCTGYAYLLKEFSKYANIECEIVNGYARTSTTDVDRIMAPNHSWNAVKLNGKWYLCDPTWASGIQDPETLKFVFHYNDGFFLATPEVFAINHFPEEKKWLLIENSTITLESFKNAPILYNDAFSNLNHHTQPKLMHNTVKKNEPIALKFQLKKTVNLKEINLLIDRGNATKKVKPKISKDDDEFITVNHSFKSTGFYDVHLFIGDKIISTYTFDVKRGK